MNLQDLLSLKEVIGSARFVYAAAMVGAHLQESKQSIAHMNELGRLDKILDNEIKELK